MSRYLIVIERNETGERFLHNPFKNKLIVPEGYFKITTTVPLNEERFGYLPLLTSK